MAFQRNELSAIRALISCVLGCHMSCQFKCRLSLLFDDEKIVGTRDSDFIERSRRPVRSQYRGASRARQKNLPQREPSFGGARPAQKGRTETFLPQDDTWDLVW